MLRVRRFEHALTADAGMLAFLAVLAGLMSTATG